MQNLPSILFGRRMRRSVIRAWMLYVVFLLPSGIVTSQDFYFKQYEVTEGLSHNTIHCAAQDDRGFMWFGTKNGLNRFDGYQFKWYQSDTKSAGSIGSNFIECIDFSQGRLWVGTDNGLFTGDPHSGNFELVDSTADRPILDVVSDSTGNLWFIAETTLYQRTKKNGTLRRYDSAPLGPARKVIVSPQNQICLVTNRGLFLYRPVEDTFSRLEIDPALDSDFPLSFSTAYFLNESSLAVGTVSHGAFIYDIPNRTSISLRDHQDNRLYVRDFLLRGNDLWIGTENGVYVYNLYAKTTRHLEKHLNRPYGLSDNAIYCLYEDRRGGVWIGSYFRGLNYYSESLTSFHRYVPLGDENSVSGMAVREMKQDKYDHIWIGTEDAGLDRYDKATGVFEHFPLRTANEQTLATNIHGLLVKDDELWAGTFQNGLFVLDLQSGKVKRHLVAGAKSGLRSNFIYTLYRTRDGSVFATTYSGVHRYREDSASFVSYPGFPEDYFYTSFLEDSDGGLWVGTYWDGLFYFHPGTGITRSYSTTATEELRISNDAINGIFEDATGGIWVATENGLNLIEPSSGKISRYNKENGFPSNVFYTILQDAWGKLWMGTANGLACFDPTTQRIDRYDTENGLVSNQFNYNSALRDGNRAMYFGGVKGFVSFDPADARFHLRPPTNKPVLTDFGLNATAATNDRTYPLNPGGEYSPTISLTYDQSTFNVSYSALDYSTPGLTEYRYELRGLNNGWTGVGNTNKLFFTDLQPGNYSLRVESRIHNSNWSAPADLLTVIISPPWWKSGFAYLSYAAFTILAILLALRFYHSYTDEKNRQRMRASDDEREKELYRAKIEFFTNVSHEILTPLTLIKNPVEKLLRTASEGSVLQRNLSLVHRNTVRLVNLVQQLLDFRKTEMEHATLSFGRVDINRILFDTIERFSGAAEEEVIAVSHNLTEEEVYAYVDAEAFRKIAGNLYQNALKYGERQVDLKLTVTETEIWLAISNDGMLIPPSERDRIFEPFYRLAAHESRPGTGLGLSLAYSLAELHRGQLSLLAGDEEKNTFLLRLPVLEDEGYALPPSVKKQSVVENAKQASNPPVRQAHRATVLLVEDNHDLLEFVATDLAENYLVTRAGSGEEALMLLEKQGAQLVISDVMMPGISGFELCQQIKTDPKLSHVPVILLTAKTSLSSEIAGLEAGADAYVTKPFSMEYLDTRISNLLANRRHIVDHFSATPLAHIKTIAQSPLDNSFISKLDELIYEALTDPGLNVEHLAERMHMSRSTLYRKIKDLTGFSPNELINLTRLKKAAELLKQRQYKVYEIAQMVGYNSATSFGRNFQKQFGMSPSDYANLENIAPASAP